MNDNHTHERLLAELAALRAQVARLTAVEAERDQAIAALRENDERLALIMAGGRLGIWDWHVPTGQVTFDPSWSSLLGYAPGELESHVSTWQRLRHPGDELSSNQVLYDYFAGLTSTFESEHRLRTKSGEWRWILVRGKAVERDASGEPVRLVGTYLDITERKLASQRYFELELEKERAKMLAKLVQDVKHEAGTSLTVLTMNLYLLKNRFEQLNGDTRFAMVEKHVNYIQNLFDALLTMARVDTPDGLWLEACDVNVLVRMVATRFNAAARDKALNLICDLSPDLPEIEADGRLIDLALTKIIENALRYTPEGGTVALRTTINRDLVAVEVRDTGIGISEENLPQIFERFFRVDKARTTRGAGLGLSIAKKIVANHGGYIAVESVLGVGSMFKVYLPLTRASAGEACSLGRSDKF